jgi:hypothetical protein
MERRRKQRRMGGEQRHGRRVALDADITRLSTQELLLLFAKKKTKKTNVVVGRRGSRTGAAARATGLRPDGRRRLDPLRHPGLPRPRAPRAPADDARRVPRVRGRAPPLLAARNARARGGRAGQAKRSALGGRAGGAGGGRHAKRRWAPLTPGDPGHERGGVRGSSRIFLIYLKRNQKKGSF